MRWVTEGKADSYLACLSHLVLFPWCQVRVEAHPFCPTAARGESGKGSPRLDHHVQPRLRGGGGPASSWFLLSPISPCCASWGWDGGQLWVLGRGCSFSSWSLTWAGKLLLSDCPFLLSDLPFSSRVTMGSRLFLDVCVRAVHVYTCCGAQVGICGALSGVKEGAEESRKSPCGGLPLRSLGGHLLCPSEAPWACRPCGGFLS